MYHSKMDDIQQKQKSLIYLQLLSDEIRNRRKLMIELKFLQDSDDVITLYKIETEEQHCS